MRAKKTLTSDLDKLLTFYEQQSDFVGGREVPVLFSKRDLDKFAAPIGDTGRYMYRGFTLYRTPGAKP